MLEENCYVVSDDSGECAIIDCGAYYPAEREAIVRYIREGGLKPVRLLATHGHLDHNFGNDTILWEFGLKPEVGAGDEKLMRGLARQAEQFYGITLDTPCPAVGRFFEEGETIRVGSHGMTVIETPGHSNGSVCFYCEEEKVLFSGDTLFRTSIGRTDFPGGSMFRIINSLRHLGQLPDDTRVLPGHGAYTTIGEELAHNPYMDR